MGTVIDAWVNVTLPRVPRPWQLEIVRQFGRDPDEVFREFEALELLERMDRSGVDRSVLTLRADRPLPRVLKFAQEHPERFCYSALVDPRQGMKALRQVKTLAQNEPLKLVRVVPSLLDLAPNDRVFYPLYALCCELELPISVNTGIPGPGLPSRCQDPLLLDDVCLFFPELKLIMANGADPWWELAIRLMRKHPNLAMMTSAYSPAALPESLLKYMTGSGQSRIMFASDFPFLDIERCLEQARDLGLPETVLEAYLGGNALHWLNWRAGPQEPPSNSTP